MHYQIISMKNYLSQVPTSLVPETTSISVIEKLHGKIYELNFSESDEPHLFFLPIDKEPYSTEYILSYEVHHKLLKLHEKLAENHIPFLKTFPSRLDLVELDHEKMTYGYTSMKDHFTCDAQTEESVRNWIIELNLALNKLGYSHI